ncbi:hypothetical protein D3C80_1461940 [compost metagenome]
MVRQARGPVLRNKLAMVVQGVDVGGHVHGDDVGRQAVDHRPRLLARAAMGHLDLQRLAAFSLPVLLEGDVVFLVEVAHHVVGDVEQAGSLGGAGGQRHAGGQQGRGKQSLHRAIPGGVGHKNAGL